MKRLPNGYGSVTKLPGNRIMPYAVREGKSGLQQLIGTARTKEEGLKLLDQYNESPWDLSIRSATAEEVFNLWCKKILPGLGKSNGIALRSAFKYCESIKKMKYKDVRSFDMKRCIDSCDKGYGTKAHIKNLFNHLDSLAYEMDIINKQYSQVLKSQQTTKSNKIPFSEIEIEKLWQNINIPNVDIVIFLIYSGFRISEFMNIKCVDVNTEQWYIIGGMKTSAGKNRLVPIHSKIKSIVQNHLEQGNEYLFINSEGNRIKDHYLRKTWKHLMEQLEMAHTPHECRHTFRSRLDSAGANKTAIDMMMGHVSAGTGERIYTHKAIQELRENIELVTN